MLVPDPKQCFIMEREVGLAFFTEQNRRVRLRIDFLKEVLHGTLIRSAMARTQCDITFGQIDQYRTAPLFP